MKNADYRARLVEGLSGDNRIYESDVLNALLTNAYSGRDMSELTNALLSRFPSVHAIVSADLGELMSVEGMTRTVALYLITVGKLANRTNSELSYIDSASALTDAVGDRLRTYDNEIAELYFVDQSGKVLQQRTYTSDLAYRVSMDLQEVIAGITTERAYGFYVVHNHVYSKAVPSADDDCFTARLLAVSGGAIKFMDHCIVGTGGSVFSYRESGRMDSLIAKK